jgi:cellulose synthase/poly-beta-1,6-N-acetylglucosamine synthase-like glycosyltransferase
MEALFWASLLTIFYAYVGYPLLLLVWSRVRPRRTEKREPRPAPAVSVVLAARNEEKNIARRLENLVAQDYPAGQLEIVVASDGSTDRTNAVVARFAERSHEASSRPDRAAVAVKLDALDEQAGKAAALNAGVAIARGEIIVFTDARQEFDRGAVRELVANFSDPSVGSATGTLLFRADSTTTIQAEMGLYWKIEKWIRRTEGRIHSVAGATGAIYAVRRSLFEELPARTILDDVLVPMRIVCRGHRNVFDDAAVAWDAISEDFQKEKRRKIRTLFGNYQLIALAPGILNPFGNPIFW